jgi:hypothetical protein
MLLCVHIEDNTCCLCSLVTKNCTPKAFPPERKHAYVLQFFCFGLLLMEDKKYVPSIMYTRHIMFYIGGERGEWRILANKYDSLITCHPWFSLLTYKWVGIWGFNPWRWRQYVFSEIMRMSDPASQHNKPEELNPQCQCCGNLTSLYVLLYYISWTCAMSKKCEMKEKLISYYV